MKVNTNITIKFLSIFFTHLIKDGTTWHHLKPPITITKSLETTNFQNEAKQMELQEEFESHLSSSLPIQAQISPTN